jgi:hypothetical protein
MKADFLTTDFTDDTDQAEAALEDGHKRHKRHIKDQAISQEETEETGIGTSELCVLCFLL